MKAPRCAGKLTSKPFMQDQIVLGVENLKTSPGYCLAKRVV
jgi:hypothetical protein